MIRDYKNEFDNLCEDIKRDICDKLRNSYKNVYRFTIDDRVRVSYAMGTHSFLKLP